MDDEILADVASSRGGSNSVTAILVDREKLMVANVGDSRAVVCGGGEVKQVTTDHEPNKEIEVIECRGGFVSKMPGQPQDLKNYMDKKLQIKLNANRMVVGTLRGFDQFMNLVVDNTVEVNGNEKTNHGIGIVM
ncbi:putative small nuclear ribonucleoprotein G [Hibiscus syriacus]|uniref:Sm protein G n=1 Tax=Hibiscus syriacus TaxID=106335 RepID=A0A6A3C5Z8_HIBSY|nr:putative small nuclear ribonucleoprotein G [Hibiscus syriacus]